MPINLNEFFKETKLVLAPLAGYTDSPFRQIAKLCGADLLVSEMISCNGLIYNEKKTMKLLKFHESERPFAIQLFGNDPELMAKAAIIVEESGADIVDINMGCPVKKVIKNGYGSALMENPKLCGQIVNKITRAVKIPVTVKIRAGFLDSNLTYLQVAKEVVDNGVSAITFHPRTRNEMFSGEIRMDALKELASNYAISVPIIGNGNIDSLKTAQKMISETGVKGLMVGRAAIGNPLIFRDLRQGLGPELSKEMQEKEIFHMICEHFSLHRSYYSIKSGIFKFRKHLHKYIKGIEGAAKLRNQLMYIEDPKDLEEFIKTNFDKIGN
ncbi:MAG: tRNA dihydrouridine synthase DusB [Pseudomonadota bacterium]